ncbi:MAG: hypothetical protein AAF417_11655 [Pseudomonadota bacterium]
MKDEDKQRHYELAVKLLSEENFPAAAIAGAVAAVIAVITYGLAVAYADYADGFAAAGIGIIVGLSMQFVGRGLSPKFGVLAAAYTIAGCILGGGFVGVMRIAVSRGVSPLEIVKSDGLRELAAMSTRGFSLVDLVYWLVAVFCAVFLARRPLSRAERLAIGLYRMRR